MEHYCGPFYFPKWLKKLISRKFNEACRIHDEGYENQLFDRKMIDYNFLENMISQASNIFDVFLALFFFILVRIFGFISWRKSKKDLD